MAYNLFIFYQENTSTKNGGEYVQNNEENGALQMSFNDDAEVRSEQVRIQISLPSLTMIC